MESNYWRIDVRRRIGRRKVLVGGSAALAAAVLAACGGNNTKSTKNAAGGAANTGTAAPAQAAATGTPKRGGVLHSYNTTETKQLDIHKAADTTVTWVGRIPYNGLLQAFEPTPGDVQIKGDLADSFEATDAANYVFKLHQGVKFHNKAPVNGREFTSQDVKANLQRLGSDQAYSATAANFSLIDSIETPDNYTVNVKLKKPFSVFLNSLATAFGPSMIAPELFDGDLAATQMIGTGPFVLDSWDPATGFKFSRNPNYFVSGRPYLDGIEHGVIPDATRALSALRSGSIDVMAAFDVANLQTVKGIPHIVVQNFGGTGGNLLSFNTQKKPYSDLRVRQAIMYATDPNEYVQVVAEGLVRRDGILSAGFTNYAWPVSRLWTPDIKKAKDLLSAAGYASGFNDQLVAGTGAIAQISTIVQRQLKQIGVNINLQPGDINAWVDSIIHCDKFAIEMFEFSNYETPDRYTYPYLHSPPGGGYPCWFHSSQLDALLDQGRATTDQQASIKVYDQMQQLAYDNVAYVPLFSQPLAFAWQGSVHGLQPGIGEASVFRHLADAWLDKS